MKVPQTAHLKTNHSCKTVDGWRLHLVRTQNLNPAVQARNYPVSTSCRYTSSACSSVPSCNFGQHAAAENPCGRFGLPLNCLRAKTQVILLPGLGSSGAELDVCVQPKGWSREICKDSSLLDSRTHALLLSGAYTFDLSPSVSLADWLSDLGWDVWTVSWSPWPCFSCLYHESEKFELVNKQFVRKRLDRGEQRL